MCTVSFIPIHKGVLFTSNRDENSHRPTTPPEIYAENEMHLVFPKDEKAGGSWIVARNDGTCIVLLNGAFIKHQRQLHYRKSRGLIMLELIRQKFPLTYFQTIDLQDIEPFTLIIFQNERLTEVKWDGFEKHEFDKSITKPHIWQSASLYSRKQKNYRKLWFEEFCRYNTPLSSEKILHFHSSTEEKNAEYGLIINRKDTIKTVSITQLLIKNSAIKMTYKDLINSDFTEKTLI